MALPNIYRLNRCCGCLSLQKGSILIGFVGMLMVLILICYQFVLIVVNEHCYQESSLAGSQLYKFKHQGYSRDDNDNDNDHDDDNDDDDIENVHMKEHYDRRHIDRLHSGRNVFECPHRFKNNYNTARFILGMTAVMLCIYFLLIAMMVHGARTQRPNLMAPWLMWTLVHIVFAILTLIGIGRLPPSDVFSELFVLGLLTYFFCVVNSYYHQLREAENGGGHAMVVAVSRPDRNNLNTSDMFVTIPSPRKADLPPPYPGMDNPNYTPYPLVVEPGMEAANYAAPPYPGSGLDPPAYGYIMGDAGNSLTASLPPPPAYSFSNDNYNTEASALSPPPPPGFATTSQDSVLRAAAPSTRVIAATQSITTVANASDDNIDNGADIESNMTTVVIACNSDESGYQGVDALRNPNNIRIIPGASFSAAANETENGNEASAFAMNGSNGGQSAAVKSKNNRVESSSKIGFVNPVYEGPESTAAAAAAAAAVLPPPQQYGDSEEGVQGTVLSTNDTTDNTSKI